jgi:hypothetical protein
LTWSKGHYFVVAVAWCFRLKSLHRKANRRNEMYYPADMTHEDIESFELDMVAAELIWNEDPINWELQELAVGA